jgi:archaetidylinositol phosphate synthase
VNQNEQQAAPTMAAARTWDQRIARALVRPFVNTSVTPNHITTIRLLLGLLAGGCIALGEPVWAWWGAGLFMLSNLIDHADGELARMTGKVTPLGHIYDIASDAMVHVLLFTALGVGLRNGSLGFGAIIMGLVSGFGVASLFWIFGHRATLLAKDDVQPRWCGFDLEDVLYLVGPVIWLGWQLPLLIAVAVVAPLAAVVLFWLHRHSLIAKLKVKDGL